MKFSALVKASLDWVIRLNIAGMIVGGLWLLYDDKLGAAWPGVLGLVVSPVIMPMLLLPAGILAGLMGLVDKSKPFAAKLLQASSILYLISVMAGYETLMFYILSGAPKGPAMVYAVAASVAPWALHARQDRGNVFYTGLILMMQASAIVLDVLNDIFRLKDFGLKYFIIWSTMLALIGLQSLYERIFLAKKRKLAQEQSLPAEKPGEAK